MRVAAGLRHDVHHQSGGLRLAQTARGRERHFLRVADVGDVVRRLVAAGRIADVEPVDRQAALVVAAAVDRELGRERFRSTTSFVLVTTPGTTTTIEL